MLIFLEDLTTYEAALLDPNMTAAELRSLGIELQAVQQRERREVEALQVMVNARSRLINELIQRLEQKIENFSGDSTDDQSDTDSNEEDEEEGRSDDGAHGMSNEEDDNE